MRGLAQVAHIVEAEQAPTQYSTSSSSPIKRVILHVGNRPRGELSFSFELYSRCQGRYVPWPLIKPRTQFFLHSFRETLSRWGIITMRLLQASLLPLLGFVAYSSANPATVPNQFNDQKVIGRYRVDISRTAAVKEAFRHSWDAYYKFAFPHDSLKPLEKGFEDDRYAPSSKSNAWNLTMKQKWMGCHSSRFVEHCNYYG